MASTSETGHAINVANFEDLINFCVGYGAAYNPSKAAIKIEALTVQLKNARTALQEVKVAKTDYDNATNEREIAFSTLRKLSTRVVSALAATDATTQTLDDARVSHNKLQGKRVAKKPEPVEGDVETKVAPTSSTSQQSYDRLVDHFAQLIQTASAERTYAPNEDELKIATLNTRLQDLRDKNTAVITTGTAISNARIARDRALYQDATGLIDTSLAVKAYIKSLFGTTSPEYKQVSCFRFI